MPQNSRQVFRTHSNYLSAIRYITCGGMVEDSRKSLELLAEKVYDSGCLKPQRVLKSDTSEIHHSITNAWDLEALYKLETIFIKEDDLIRLSNNWCMVQAYYIFYYSTQALAVTEGLSIPKTHAQVQKAYLLLWSAMPSILAPWSISFDEDGFHNLPPDSDIDDHIHSWKKVDESTALSIYCKALRTTREEYIAESLAKRRERHAAQKGTSTVKFTDEQKMQTISRVRPTTLISYLFRLKRKTSYEQSSILALGPQNKYQSEELRNDLLFLIESTMLITEFMVSRIIGEDKYYSWCKDWDKYKSPRVNELGPEQRFDIIF